ncbi:MAG: Gfo/Idh/MocA family protein [Gemmataceae bacterium]
MVTDTSNSGPSRRDVLKTSGKVAAASALAGLAIPAVHARENNTIQVALVGCGGRGTGAAADALNSKNGPTRLVAMADVFSDRLKESYNYLKRYEKTEKAVVPSDRKFLGFDAYKHAMDCLNPGDVVILTTPPAFRWVHLTYAIQKGLNVFMEKPVTVDGPSTRKMLKLAEEAKAKNLKIGVGLMCRHCASRGELFQRIKDGQIGDLTLLRAYRVKDPEGNAYSGPRKDGMSELHYQIRRFHSFLWASGGCYSDFLIHNIDECCWMKDAWPIVAKAVGGRQYRNYTGSHGDIDQNFDHYAVEYTFADGTKLLLEGRNTPGCWHEFASYAHGTKGSAIISTSSHAPSKCRIFKTQNNNPDNKTDVVWRAPKNEPNPYQLEWDHLLEAIRQDKPYNEAKRGAEASLVTAMGRMAAHTGQVVTWDAMLNCEHEFAPEVDRLKMDSPAPVQAGPDGKYPVPEPGRKKDREY